MITKKWKHLSLYWKSILFFSCFVLLCLLLSRIPSFCDFYTDHLFPLGLQTYGRIMGLLPFSAGEILIAVFGVLVLLQTVLVLLLLLFRIKKNRRIYRIRYPVLKMYARLCTPRHLDHDGQLRHPL